MRKTLHKWFWVWDFEKEENWINEMSSRGLQLVDVGFCTYVFEEGEPNEYTVRLQLLDSWASSVESQQYIKFVEETGAHEVGRYGRWIYFRKKNNGTDFEIFSDFDSRIKPLNGLLFMFGALGISQLCILVSNLIIHFDAPAIKERLPFLALSGLAAFLMCYAFVRIWLIRRKLKKERTLRE